MAKKVKDANEYNEQSISMLKGSERVRKRPAVIFGSDGLEGCQHSFLEILANSVDEAREGYGSEIYITVTRERVIEVEDFGRGIPLGYNEAEKMYNWQLIFCELYAGGKYNNNQEGGAYEYSLGLNGLGACATQYASEFMEVRSYNGTTLSEIDFKKGDPASELRVRELTKDDKKKQGTIIRWKPDLEVFTDIDIPLSFYEVTLRRQAVVNAGLRFVLKAEDENGKFQKSEYYYENGIGDYIREISDGNALTEPVLWKMEAKGRDREDKPEYKLKAEIAFCTTKMTNATEYYHNSSFLEHGGSPDKAVRTAFVYAIDKYLKAQGKYNKNEQKISYADVAENLLVIINSASTQTSYENQTKKAISNTFIQKALTDYLKNQLDIYFTENPVAAQTFAGQVLISKRSREKAEATKIDTANLLSKGNTDLARSVEKFVACHSKDKNIRELYIVEGDSAMSSCKLARNAEFQAIIPIRGKTLNCLKSSYARIFESPIITDLLRVIGCGVEIVDKKDKVTGKSKSELGNFDWERLNWSKIIICTDADEDGFQIRTLLLTLFYRLLPTLIERGKIYIAESPLFEITTKDETYFAYNEQEKTEILAKLEGKKYTLQRSKGLGENEPDMMWKTTMCPSSRRLIAVQPADAEQTAYIFETLLGDAIEDRKKFIAENGAFYVKDADV
ncbi:MAG: DNA topoisomerase [Clostridia bacterium]|nr:DNA topoisomerase [Clostridia bacterium]